MALIDDLPITIDREKIVKFCQSHGISRLSIFGSVLRDDFDPHHSDVDVLVEFLPAQTPGWEFFVWHEELEAILGYKIDLFSGLNRWVEPIVHQEALLLYEQV
jgi:predicted nucleotidyltransferase